ncbi:MAG: transposase [Thermoanaerobaculia bacterium]|nr:transposase [Thermoanaerobaculia bacterium]
MTRYVAVDLETANADLASICQVGLVAFDGGIPIDEWATLVDPEDFFDPVNIAIHGISEETVANAPDRGAAFEEIARRLEGQVAVCHTPFDRTALLLCAERLGRNPPTCRWLDTARVARRSWSQFRERGFGLAPLAAALGIEFRHHDALEDARAAGQILSRAMRDSGLGLEEWLVRAQEPFERLDGLPAMEGSPNGPLAGEVVVFTGRLLIPRREATSFAAGAGCRVDAGVTKETTLLVVGDQDTGRLAGHDKSSKHRKAEELIAKGQSIRILRESDFRRIAAGPAALGAAAD